MGFGGGNSSGRTTRPNKREKDTLPTPPLAPIYSTMTPDYTSSIVAAQRKKQKAMSLAKTILGSAQPAVGQAAVATKTLLGQ